MKLIPSRAQFKIIFLCLTSGLLTALSFPPFQFWFLVYFGIVILLYLVTSSENYKQAFFRGYLAILFLNIFSLYWISSWGSDDIFIKIGGAATVLIHPLFFLIPIMIFYFIYRTSGLGISLMLFPFLWVGFEYFHSNGQLAFPWIELGNTETYNLNRIQYIDYTGVHGISFLICIISALLFYLINKLVKHKYNLYSKQSIISFIFIIILIIAPNIYSYYFLNSAENQLYNNYSKDSTKNIKAVVLQTNVDPWKKWFSQKDELVNSYISKLQDATKLKPDLIVLHETATPFYFFNDYYHNETKKFIDFVNASKTNLLMGIPHLYYYNDLETAPKDSRMIKETGKRYDTFNSAVLLEPDKNKNDYQIYSKVKLVPISERVPYQEYLPFLKDMIKWGVGLSSWQIGSEMTLFRLKTKRNESLIKFAALICFESAFSEYVSEFVKNGAKFIIIITNDGWFGNSSGPYQHQQFAVLRAIENRKWIIRSSQTGISCFIDPLGNTYEKTEFNTEATITKEIIANNEQTFYSKNGDLAGKVSFCLSIGSFIVVLCVRVFKKRSKRKF